MASAKRLKPEEQHEFRIAFEQSRAVFDMSSRIYGESAYVYLGGFELENLLKASELTLLPRERTLLLEIISERMTRDLADKQKINLDSIYVKATWDKQCRAAFNRSLHYGLSKDDADKISAIKVEAFNRGMTTARELFGTRVSNQLYTFLTAVDIVGPMSLDAYFHMIDSTIAFQLMPWNRQRLEDVYKMLYDLRTDGDSQLGSLCNNAVYEPVRDQESGGHVILSSYSMRNFNMGLSIAAHEMGHAVGEGMKAIANSGEDISDFIRIRQCLNKNYQRVNRPSDRFAGDMMWTEEDWADVFSGHSTRDLNSVNACTFFGAWSGAD